MFLKQLVHGNQPYKFLLFEDTLDSNGRVIVKLFIENCLSKGDEVHFYCFGNLPSKIEKEYSIPKRDRLHFHDFFSDVAGWLRETQGHECKNVFSAVSKPATSSSTNNNSIVVIDSLSSFICAYGLSQVYRLLHHLIQSSIKGNSVKQILGVIHPDVLTQPETTLSQMRHLSTVWMSVYPVASNNFKRGFVKISQKKPNAKLFRQTEEFWLDSNNELNCKKVEASKELTLNNTTSNEIPKELTTFKLDLEDQEKLERSQLVLPYLKTEKSGGTIYYEPDENDDWDEEDPDDDLDI